VAPQPRTAREIPAGPPGVRRIYRPHWRGLWTLYRFGVIRLSRIVLETIVGPILSALLFLAVFAIALADTQGFEGEVSFLQFLVPGIAAFAMIQAAYQMAAFPVVYDKLEGTLADQMMSPLMAWEIALVYALVGATAGLIVGAGVLGIAWSFVPLALPNPGLAAAAAVLAALAFAFLGTITGLWAQKWDQLSVIDTFLMLPLAFLSGAFFAIDRVPAVGETLIRLNPVTYAIDAVRFGATGWHATHPALALAVVAALALSAGALSMRLYTVGWKIKP
jgi:ABC-2 type transport system permease protein